MCVCERENRTVLTEAAIKRSPPRTEGLEAGRAPARAHTHKGTSVGGRSLRGLTGMAQGRGAATGAAALVPLIAGGLRLGRSESSSRPIRVFERMTPWRRRG